MTLVETAASVLARVPGLATAVAAAAPDLGRGSAGDPSGADDAASAGGRGSASERGVQADGGTDDRARPRPVRRRHDWTDDEPIATTVALAVAAATRRPPTETPPLAHSVDPDALSDLFARREGRPPAVRTAEFRHEDLRVRVTVDGVVTVTPASDPTP